jgi:hypothetical protein
VISPGITTERGDVRRHPPDGRDHVAQAHLAIAQPGTGQVPERPEPVVDADRDHIALAGQAGAVVPVQ